MEKEFVPYELALALKELGFDEPCFGYYDLDGLQVNTHHWYPENKNSSFPLPHTTNNPKISAPTLPQAFRWFREKYPELDFGVGKIHNGTNNYHYHINLQWEFFEGTYEEAELACLKKLIEIVKNLK